MENIPLFELSDSNLQKGLMAGLENVYLRSFWWTADGKKHNSEAAKGHIYYGRFCTRELLWYHDVLLGQSQYGMQESLFNDIEIIWPGQNQQGNVPRGYGAGGPDFHYDVAEYGKFDDRFKYDYTWIYYPIDNVPALIITTIRAYQYTGDREFLSRMAGYLHRAFKFMDSITCDYLYGMGWDAEESIDWREQVHVDESHQQAGHVLAEDIGINGCTTYNQALFCKAVALLAEAEEVLGNKDKSAYFREYAHKAREQANRDYREGGLWDSNSGTYIGWKGRDGQPHFLYGSYRFEPMAQIWAAYWGLPENDQALSIAALFDRNFDRYITPHGYVLVCDPPYMIWDGWYFGGYAAVVLARYGYRARAQECLRRMAENFTRSNQPYEHENSTGEPVNKCSCNVVPVINALRVVKEAIFGIEVDSDALRICPLLEGEGTYHLLYRGKPITIVKKGSGVRLSGVKLNGAFHSFDPEAGLSLWSSDLKEENILEIQMG
ncbi:hypothetical protein DRQ00_04365 [candidate division KSB1 bacterium]|nr:MAG: hypothetical protein DRQ00_04365 [candidate division KSB1 bacterium]